MFTRATNRTSGEQTYRKLCVYYWSLRCRGASRLTVACAADPWKYAHISAERKKIEILYRDRHRACQPEADDVHLRGHAEFREPPEWCTRDFAKRRCTRYSLAVTSRNSSLIALIYCSGVDKIWTIYFASYSLFYIQFLHIFIPTNVGTLTFKERSDWDRLFYIFIRDNWFSRIASRQHKSAERSFSFKLKRFILFFFYTRFNACDFV